MSPPAVGVDGSPHGRARGVRRLDSRWPWRVVRNLARFSRDAVVSVISARTSRAWVVIRLDRGVVEVAPPAGLAGSWGARTPCALSQVLEALERLRGDPEVEGVLLRAGSAPIGWGKMHSISRALEAVRAGGKRIVVYATHGSNAAAWLGALADQFWMAPQGRLDLVGLRLESPFLREALDRLGVRPLVVQAGRYKGIGEILERDSMSADSREALDAVAEDLYASLVAALARRAGDETQARAWIDEGPYLAAQAFERGIVDALVYPDQLPDRLLRGDASDARGSVNEASSEEVELAPLAAESYLRLTRPRFHWQRVTSPEPCIAVIPLVGAIGSETARRVCRGLRALREDPTVAAAVLRIDSPGGDPGASDLIWHEVGRLRERKPVVASLGDTAASGGYYAAMAANAIVAEPTTLTGSIGVAMAGLEVGPALASRGIRFDGVQRGRHAGIYGWTGSRSDEERAVLRRQVEILYDDFVEKAALGRSMQTEAMHALAQGRVWTGAAALREGLVDALGGPAEAVARARELAGLGPEEGQVVTAYAPPGLLRRLWERSDDSLALALALGRAGGALEEAFPWQPGPKLWCPIRATLR